MAMTWTTRQQSVDADAYLAWALDPTLALSELYTDYVLPTSFCVEAAEEVAVFAPLVDGGTGGEPRSLTSRKKSGFAVSDTLIVPEIFNRERSLDNAEDQVFTSFIKFGAVTPRSGKAAIVRNLLSLNSSFEKMTEQKGGYTVDSPTIRSFDPLDGDTDGVSNPELVDDMPPIMARSVTVGRPLPIDAVYEGDDIADPTPIPPEGPPPKGHVIVAVIDEGMAFASERFRSSPLETRVRFSWAQDAAQNGPVRGFNYGRELRKTEIDALLAGAASASGQVNEDTVYSRAGISDFGRRGHKAVSWQRSHGAHVMDLAAGFPMNDTAILQAKRSAENQHIDKDNVHIISVQLPTSVVAETSGLGLEKFFIDGLEYIFDRATELAADLDCGELPRRSSFPPGTVFCHRTMRASIWGREKIAR